VTSRRRFHAYRTGMVNGGSARDAITRPTSISDAVHLFQNLIGAGDVILTQGPGSGGVKGTGG